MSEAHLVGYKASNQTRAIQSRSLVILRRFVKKYADQRINELLIQVFNHKKST